MIPVILAGGAGTRFWPLSRYERPKQLVELWDDQTMLEATVDRLADIADRDRILVVCGDHLLGPIREVLSGFQDRQFIVEPEPRNTAPAIALATCHAADRWDDEPVGIFPADHYIRDREAFADTVAAATTHARSGRILTLGIEPTRPETGYGYIHANTEETLAPTDTAVPGYPVRAFVEKPSRAVARDYLAAGDYLWNAGMFCFEPETLFAEMRRQRPEMAEAFDRIRSAIGTDREATVLEDTFGEVESISIDYGIMEGAEQVGVVPARFGWSDVGHWAALDEVRSPDADGNVVDADAVCLDVDDSVVFADTDRFIGAVGLDSTVVVDTDDALLVVDKESAQDVKTLVQHLEDEGRDDVL